jgi:hypothetical protein
MNNTYNLNNYLESNEEFPVIIVGDDAFTVIDTVENKLEFQKQVMKNPNDLIALYTIAFGSAEKAQKLVDKKLRVKNADAIFLALWGIFNGKTFEEAKEFFRVLNQKKK